MTGSNFRRLLAVLLALILVIPMTAIGEAADPANDAPLLTEAEEAFVPEEDEGELPEALPESVEDAPQEQEFQLSANGAEVNGEEEPVPQTYPVTISTATKTTTVEICKGDTVRIRVSDATITGVTPAKGGIVSVGSVESDSEGQYVDVKALTEIKKLKLTVNITHPKKKKLTMNLVINNPYTPTAINPNPDIKPVPSGTTLKLADLVTLVPSYADPSLLTWKVSGAGKLNKGDGTFTTTKAGDAKITVTVSSNKKIKTAFSVKVLDNKVDKLNSVPGDADYNRIKGYWTLWPLSVGVNKKGGLDCQFYLLNATGQKVTQIENMDLTLAVGTPENTVARYTNVGGKALKASVADRKYKAIKLSMAIVGDMAGAFLPDHKNANTLFFNINYNSVRLAAKKTSFEYFVDKFPSLEKVQSITLSHEEAIVAQGKKLKLTASVLPATASDKRIDWTSDNPAVATVDNGVVTGVSEGTAIITATAADGGGAKATCAITVNLTGGIMVTSITLSQSTMVLQVGKFAILSAQIIPANATRRALNWSSDDPTVAKVAKGRITAVREGTATITATAADGGPASASCVVTVTDKALDIVPVTAISLNEITASLDVGDTLPLTATVTPEEATYKAVEWTTSDAAIAEVDNGLVTAVAEGSVTITATATDGSGISASCDITVSPTSEKIKVTGIKLNHETETIVVGSKLELIPTITPENATDPTLSWSSSDATVATVDENGLVTAVAAGEATITAQAMDGSGVFASCTVTVSEPDNSEFVIENGVVTGYNGAGGAISIPAKGSDDKPVTAIGEAAFKGNTAITSVSISSAVTEIQASAFEDCSALESVVAPNGITVIGRAAFKNCTKLSSMSAY